MVSKTKEEELKDDTKDSYEEVVNKVLKVINSLDDSKVKTEKDAKNFCDTIIEAVSKAFKY